MFTVIHDTAPHPKEATAIPKNAMRGRYKYGYLSSSQSIDADIQVLFSSSLFLSLAQTKKDRR